MGRATEPFYFQTRLHLRELTGVSAATLPELLEGIRTLPGSVIYHHTHHYLQQHQYLSPEPPNDFAYWVRESLGDDALAEGLLAISTHEFESIRALRERVIEVIENHLNTVGPGRRAPEGEEFNFIRAISFIFPTPDVARNLREFIQCLRHVTIHSLYFHMFESRLRLERGGNDFSLWFETALNEAELAERVTRLDPYSYTMEGLRTHILALVEERLRANAG